MLTYNHSHPLSLSVWLGHSPYGGVWIVTLALALWAQNKLFCEQPKPKRPHRKVGSFSWKHFCKIIQKEQVLKRALNTFSPALFCILNENFLHFSWTATINAKLKKREITSSNHNYLPAYQTFRDKLLKIGYGIKCNSSRLHAVQSGIMGAADIDTFPDTSQQNDFCEHCIKR